MDVKLKNQNVLWIFDNDKMEKDIKNIIMDMDINAFDGSGMISVEMAQKWSKDLDLDYLPASFIIRSAWIKGLVSVFDFKKFAKEVAHKDTIVDAWGNEKNIDNIDVILTTSQFKMYKKYENWQEYMYFHRKYDHIFGVARVSKKKNDFMTTLNYQYIQSNNYNQDTIVKVAETTVDWLRNIMKADRFNTTLFLLGDYTDVKNIYDIDSLTDNYIAKSLLYNEEILNDSYVRSKINQMIEKKIRLAKIGKLYVEGSYDFAIPDLYAMAEHAFGMEVKGILKEGESWNKRWVDKGSKNVAMMRSPLVAPAENQTRNIHFSEKADEWFKYIYSGNIMSIWDNGMIKCSDADYDGDIVLTTDNEYVVNAAVNGYCITYEKSKSKEHYINQNSFYNVDTRSFNTKIGFITNLASNLIAMLSNFDPNSEEYKEIRRRIDLLRFYQGSCIDSVKGDTFTPPPKYWYKKQKYIDTKGMDGKELEDALTKNKVIVFNNKICCTKKSYFFGYVYPKIMKENKKHKNIYNQICFQKFGCDIKSLEFREDKTEDQKKLLYQYRKYMPLMENKSIMNILSKYIEGIEFDNKWSKPEKEFDWKILLSGKYEIINNNMIKKISNIIKDFNKTQKILSINLSYMNDSYNDEEKDDDNIFKYLFNVYENELLSVCSNTEKLCDYVVYVYYNFYKNHSKSLLWNVFGNEIVNVIKSKSDKISYPVKDDSGQLYLGEKFKLKEIDIIK